MDEKQLIEITKDNLARVLGFFPRVDTIMSLLLATNLGLLAVLGANTPPAKELDGYATFAVVFVLLATITFIHLYKCAFPRLDGGHTSLIYFREVANKTELKYQEAFKEMTEDDYLNDMLEQVWRNSKILTEKFNHIRWAFTFLLISLIFWLPALLSFVSRNTQNLLAK